VLNFLSKRDIIFTKTEQTGDIMLKFICYPKCTTCQRAKAWLDNNGIKYELRDIKLSNPTLDELTIWYKQSRLPLKKFFNTSGLLYKSMDLKSKLPNMSETQMLQLLSTDGMLVKRPLLIDDDFVLVGFKEDEWAGKMNY
jgi:arsenate reductase